MRFPPLLPLLLLAACTTTLAQTTPPTYPPASQLTIQDEAGKPLPRATIHLTRLGESPAEITLQTDAAGNARITRTMPAQNREWPESLTIEKTGTLKHTQQLTLFTGAQLDKTITLESERRTVISVVGPDGQPAAGLSISAWGENRDGTVIADPWPSQPQYTDEHGDFVFRHGALPKGMTVNITGHSEHLTDAPTATLKLTTAEMAAAELTKVRKLQGRLLLPDGTPATHWFIPQSPVAGGLSFSSGALITYGITIGKLNPVQSDGTFQTQTGSTLAAVSPQGVPVLFDLNPSMWEAGEHRVTITLPPSRRNAQGQFLGPDGKPKADLPLHVQSFSAANKSWWLTTVPGEEEQLAAAGLHFGIKTDAEGRYSVPLPVGVWADFSPDATQWSVEGIAPTRKINPVNASRNAPEVPLKDITLQFVDEKGTKIEPPPVTAIIPGSTPATPSQIGPLIDTRGLHFFVAPQALQLQISVGPEPQARLGWNAFTKSIPLPGTGDQQLTVTLDSALRWKPAKGRILDPAGNGVAGATLYPFVAVHENNRTIRSTFGSVETDAQGRFEFPGLPDNCQLQFVRFDATGNSQDLPGWAEPASITPQKRDVEIRLRPTGSIRIILPENLHRDPGMIYLEKLNIDANDSMASTYLVADMPTHSLVARRAVPGSYRFNYDALPELGTLLDQRFDVQERQETTLDWSKHALAQFSTAPSQFQTLHVEADGKPLSGAQVTILAERWPKEIVAGWIRDWSEAEGTTRAEPLENRLRSAAGTASDLLDAMRGNDALATNGLRRVLQPAYGWQPDSLVVITRDLTDDAGNLRFQAEPGRQYVAVAQSPGKYLGWQSFTASDTPIPPVSMKPTRPLVAHLAPWAGTSPDWDPRELHLHFVAPAGIERRALMRVLGPTIGGPDFIGDSHANTTTQVQIDLTARSDTPNTRVFEDLPINASYEVRLTSSGTAPPYQLIKVDAGEGPIEFKP